MEEKSEMQSGEPFATDSPIKEAPPAEYRKKDGTPFTAADLVTLNAGGYIECIEKRGDAEIETTIAGSLENLDNVPDELKKPGSQTIYFPGGDLEVALTKAKGQAIEVLRLIPEEDLRMYGRALQQYYLDNLDAVKLLEESAPSWVKETAIFLHQEQSGNPIFEGVSLMDFLQAAFDINNKWTIKDGPYKEYVEQERRVWERSSPAPRELPSLKAIIPSEHIMPSSKLANSVTDEDLWKDTLNLIVSPKKSKKEILIHCSLSYEGDNLKISSRRPFTEYDRQVCDAVTSIFEYGDSSHIITPPMVYRAMVNATETETPSQQAIDAVTNSLDKMRFIRVVVDCSEELKSRGLSLNGDQITKGIIDTYLLSMEKVTVVAGGQEVTGYHILRTPILYAYSKILNQVSTVPAMLLDVKDEKGKTIRNTEKRIAIKGYLLRRISAMKGSKGQTLSNHITYSSVNAAVSGIDTTPPDKVEARRRRDYINDVLSFWTREGWIKGHTITKKGKEYTGVEILI